MRFNTDAATMHWLISGGVGTMKVVHDTPVDAVATRNNLLISGPATDRAAKCSLESGFQSDSPIAFDGDVLRLRELHVRVDSNLQTPNLQIKALGSALRFQIPPKTDWRIALTVESSPTRRFETGIDLR